MLLTHKISSTRSLVFPRLPRSASQSPCTVATRFRTCIAEVPCCIAVAFCVFWETFACTYRFLSHCCLCVGWSPVRSVGLRDLLALVYLEHGSGDSIKKNLLLLWVCLVTCLRWRFSGATTGGHCWTRTPRLHRPQGPSATRVGCH